MFNTVKAPQSTNGAMDESSEQNTVRVKSEPARPSIAVYQSRYLSPDDTIVSRNSDSVSFLFFFVILMTGVFTK